MLVIVILAAISIPLIGNWLRAYRLGIAAQAVVDQLQTTKMLAVSKSRNRSLLFDVAGNRVGQEGGTLVPLPTGVAFGHGAATSPPEEGMPLDPPVSFPPTDEDANLRAATFTGRGLPDADPGETFVVYVTNVAGTRAVTMTSAGNLRVREWTGGGWK